MALLRRDPRPGGAGLVPRGCTSDPAPVFGLWVRVFDPVLPGNGAFYTDLQTQVARYYPGDSPSFLHAIDLAVRVGSRDCMDLGCGDGGFLDLARAKGIETHGLDLNPKAVAAAQAKGHDVHASTAEAFAQSHSGRQFSLVTAFEVMEHVPDPVAFSAMRPDWWLRAGIW